MPASFTTPPPPTASAPARLNRRHLLVGSIVILVFAVAQALYAIHLNRVFYASHGPFYDSVSYLRQLADLIHVTKTDGFLAALKLSASISTVFLPFGFVPFFGSFVEPDRAIGVWLQVPWVLMGTGTLAYYLVRHRRANLPLALSLSILFVSLHAVYFWVGGLADFRVDLPFGLLFSTTMLWLLIALREQARWTWILFGAAAGICCLARATAPVFLVLTCLPMVAFDLVAATGRRLTTLKGLLIAAGVCGLLCGWFYLLNWSNLHYYYFVWNLDANANLPLAASAQHIGYALGSVGPIILKTVALCAGLAVAHRLAGLFRQENPAPVWPTLRQWLVEIDWRALAPSLVPVGYLVISGAGPNGLVSVPSAFGLVLLILSLAGHWPDNRIIAGLISALALVGSGLSAHTGLAMHRVGPGTANPASAYAAVAQAIEAHASVSPRTELHVAHFGVGDYHNIALTSHLIYDRHLPGYRGRVQLKDKTLVLDGPTVFEFATKVEWDALPGADDEQRTQHVVDTINREADLLVMPMDYTAAQLVSRMAGVYINHHSPRIRQRLLETGQWEPTGAPFRASHWEEDYVVLRNKLRHAPP
jgi:hypothetical protein